jgi:hypothetical protein
MKFISTAIALTVALSLQGFGNFAFAQAQESNEHQPILRLAVMMANSHIPEATSDKKKIVVVPTWGFDIDYYFHKHWSLALQGDIELQSFQVKDDDILLERSNPFAIAVVLHYHAVRNWSFYTGPGYEFERHENFTLVKIGTEYSFEINNGFEIALNLVYENKEEVYDAWTFGIAFNKRIK